MMRTIAKPMRMFLDIGSMGAGCGSGDVYVEIGGDLLLTMSCDCSGLRTNDGCDCCVTSTAKCCELKILVSMVCSVSGYEMNESLLM